MTDYTGQWLIYNNSTLWFIEHRLEDGRYKLQCPYSRQVIVSSVDPKSGEDRIFTTEKAVEVWAALQGVDLV